MGFDRKALKEQAKPLFQANYWPAVVAALALAVATGKLFTNNSVTYQITPDTPEEIQQLIARAAAMAGMIGLLLKIFVLNPLEYGGKKFFLKNMEDRTQATMSTLGSGFESANYMPTVSVLLYRNVIIFLYALLLIIPGIIKSYQYYFVPQILADNPGISPKDACDRSKLLTDGHKMDLFVLDLSFILWEIGSSLTAGLLGIFYSNPYIYQTQALAYRALLGEERVNY